MIRRFFSQAFLYHKGRTAAFHPVEFLCFDAGYPLVTLVFYCLLASYTFHTTDLTHWVVGNAFLMCTNTCVFQLGGIFSSERYFGRLRSIVAAPCGKLPLVLASGVFPILFASLSVLGGFVLGGVAFGVDFSNLHPGLAVVTILCAMTAATGFGLFLAALGLLTDSMHLVLNVVSYLLMIFTGAEFPVDQLPLAGQLVAQLLPLTRSIQAMNLTFDAQYRALVPLLAGEMLLAAVYVWLAWAIFRIAETMCRKHGTFDLF